MNTKEISKVISNYTPHKGFFDLGNKPKNLCRKTYAKIIKIQSFLIHQSKHSEYLKEYCSAQWQKDKELSAQLQQIIFEYWDINNL